jgi:hypothetical protein
MYGYGFRRGFAGEVPPWPYVGRGKAGMPRCLYPSFFGFYFSTKQDELNYLKERSRMLKEELEWIEERIKTLETQN